MPAMKNHNGSPQKMTVSDNVKLNRPIIFSKSPKFIVTFLVFVPLSCPPGLETINEMISQKLNILLDLRLIVQYTNLFFSVNRKIPTIFQVMLTLWEINRQEDLLTWIKVST